MTRGKYIVIEGPEGVGKTTQLRLVADQLRASGLAVRQFREPDSQSDLTARSIRHLTQDPQYPMNTRTEVLLYNAGKWISVKKILCPKKATYAFLKQTATFYSTSAYSKMMVKFTYSKASGAVWFDGISLIK